MKPKLETLKPEIARQLPAILNSRKLFGSNRRILIEHNNQHYELRITRQNKLILTK